MKILRIFLFFIVTVVTVLALTVAWFGYQGRKEWAKTRAELIARGEKLSITDIIPPEIPPEDNFFADPVWDEVFDLVPQKDAQGIEWMKPRLPENQQQISQFTRDFTPEEIKSLEQRFPEFVPIAKNWKENIKNLMKRKPVHIGKSERTAETPKEAEFVLALLKPSTRMLQHLIELSKRPYARASLHYSENSFMGVPHLAKLLGISSLLYRRIDARLALNDSAAAFNDLLLLFRFQKIPQNESYFMSLLIEMAINSCAIISIKNGISLWSEDELKTIVQTLEKIDFVKEFPEILRGERCFSNAYFDFTREKPLLIFAILQHNASAFDSSVKPLQYFNWGIYWFVFYNSDRAFLNQFFQEWIDSLQREYPNLTPKTQNTMEQKLQKIMSHWNIPHLGSIEAGSVLIKIQVRVARTQNRIRQAIIACALQRWLLANGSLPETLDELVPKYLQTIPADIVTGGPMHYRRTSANTYDLWSVGWNQTDEGGKPGQERKPEEADWVWGPEI